MAAISRRGQGGRIYNNTRVRELLRRKCVKPADLTTHFPPKTFARPRTATRPSRALPRAPAAPTHARRLRDAFPAEDPLPPPHSDTPFPSTSAPPRSADACPTQSRRTPAGCAMHSRRPHNPFPAATRCLSFRSASGTKNGTAQCMCDAECFGRPSLRSVIWVGEPRAVRRRCGALACRRGA